MELDHHALLQALPDPVVVVDPSARLLWANRAAEDWGGWPAEEFVGRSVDGLVHPDDLGTALVSLSSVQTKEVGTAVELRLRDRSGVYHRFEVRGRSMIGSPGVDGLVLVLRDVTDRRRWEVAAGDASLHQVIAEYAPTITMLLGPEGDIRGANRALTTLIGRDLEDTLGESLRNLADPRDASVVTAELALVADRPGSRSFEARFTDVRTGRPVPLSLTAVNLIDDRTVEGLVVTASDITALAEARSRLAHLATHDPLTGLANRALLFDRLAHALEGARRRSSMVSLVFCDVDGFKRVNDEHGHRGGDQVLVEIARRLDAVARSSDTVARIGGDEFVLLLEGGDPEGAATLVERIESAMTEPIVLPTGAEVVVHLSVGSATDLGGLVADDLLDRADAAMYLNKGADAEQDRHLP